MRDAGAVAGGLRVRHIGARPADEASQVRARASTIWELFASWRVSRATLTLTVDNLFDAQWNEAQFATTSRLAGESTETTELHFTPGAPRSIQLGAEFRF